MPTSSANITRIFGCFLGGEDGEGNGEEDGLVVGPALVGREGDVLGEAGSSVGGSVLIEHLFFISFHSHPFFLHCICHFQEHSAVGDVVGNEEGV